jgi:hypothetical protein
MNEGQIQKQAVAWFNLQPNTFAYSVFNGGLMNSQRRFMKNKPDRPPGFPDVLCIHSGITIYLEFKSARGRLSASQKALHKRLVACGAQVYVVRSFEEALTAYRISFPSLR